jgi:ribosomal protein S18 acetylase RimI-like enzyme
VADDVERIVAMSRWFADVTSSRVEEWRYGTALYRDDFPRRWDSNFLRVEQPVGDGTAAELAATADALQAHLRHRELVVEDPDDGARLAPGFADLGYEVDRLLWMVQRREPDRAPSLGAREVTLEEFRPVTVAANLESHGGMSAEDAEMLADFDAVVVENAGARFFLADVDDRPAAAAALYVHDGAAEVDAVHTLTPFRNRGGARAAVTAAIEVARSAGADLVWLLADADDWPKELYRKLGFDPIGSCWQYTKPPPDRTYR